MNSPVATSAPASPVPPAAPEASPPATPAPQPADGLDEFDDPIELQRLELQMKFLDLSKKFEGVGVFNLESYVANPSRAGNDRKAQVFALKIDKHPGLEAFLEERVAKHRASITNSKDLAIAQYDKYFKFKAPHSWLGDGVLPADYSWSRVPHPMQIRYLQDDIEECANYRIKQEKRKAGRSWIQTWANRLDSAFDLYYQLRALDIPMQGILKYFNEARTTRKIKRKNRELDCEGYQLYCAQKRRTMFINH